MRINYLMIATVCVALLSSCATSKKIRLADDLYEETSFYNAAEKYEEVVQKKPNNSRLAFQLAETNRALKDYKQSEKWYKKTLDLNDKAWPEAQFYYAQSLKNQGEYEDAKREFKKYIEAGKDAKKPSDEAKDLAKLAELEIEGCDLALEMLEEKSYSEVETMEAGANNNLQDLSPKVVGNNKLLMGALLPEKAVNLDEAQEADEDYYTKLYFAEYKNGAWVREMLPETINSDDKHVGNGVLTPDGNTMYYTICEEDAAQVIVCNIYTSTKSGNEWSSPEAVSGVNRNNFTTTQPALGMDADGNEVLYFASNRSGSKGGMDIYYAVKNQNGDFSVPKNMGSAVNTQYDEMTPFYDNTNQVLYFSSNGHPGMGGLDVFKTAGNVGDWSGEVINAGQPLNSSADDLYLALNEAGSKGYMVSNREGTTSNRGETCCDDVFKVSLKKDKIVEVIAKIEGTETVLEGVEISMYKIVEDDFEFVGEGLSSKSDDLYFTTEEEYSYKINGNKEGFWPNITTLTNEDLMAFDGDTMQRVIYLKPITRLKVKNVYFAFDKDNIREMYQDEMDSVYTIMMDYPEVLLEIGGHTDSKGSDDYNQKLSERRANAAKEYFLEKEVTNDRVIVKGYGESQAIAPNENPDGSDNPEGRAKNRRVEFKLVNEVNEDFQLDVEYSDEGPETID